MNTNNSSSTILYEHKKVVNTRYILATINFIAILLGTLVTLFFVQRRGIYDIVLGHIYALIAINVLQIVLCITEYVLKTLFGRNLKSLPKISYGVGVVWLGVLISELLFATVEAGALRTDLLIIAGIQFVMALIAYIFWPMLDRKAIDAMIRHSVRENDELKNKKSKRFVAIYGVICVFVVLAQAAALFMYKLPPTFYDLFADTRALQYQYNEDLDGYEVKAVYQGTSNVVNIPATYNNKPVIGIASGAIVDPTISEKYKFDKISFGTETVNSDGETTIVCNLTYLSANSIVSNTITDIEIPASVSNIADGAIKSDSLKSITYMAGANFTYSSFECSSLKDILMSGSDVGQIYSLEGMPSTVTISVAKDIYNQYRQANMEYVANFSPILDSGEYCIDFFTDSNYYLNSIFAKAGETVSLNYEKLVNESLSGVPISYDTLMYIRDKNELGSDGAKKDSAFRGWYYDSDFSLECEFTENGNIVFDKSTKLYAKWIDEYTGTLNWGTHKPTNAETTLYWTDSDEIEFPVVTDRLGYSGGVTWTYNGQPVTTSYGISESVTLNGLWNLDAPEVTLVDAFNDQTGNNDYAFQFALNYGAGQFTYDETRNLTVSANPDHPLSDVTYNYTWEKADNSTSSIGQNFRVSNVSDGGKYYVTVTAVSTTKESASTTCELDITIYKKQIIMEGVSLPNLTTEYAAKSFQVEHTGTINSNGVDVTYRYYDAEENYIGVSGVTDVGEYYAEAVIEKDENYEIVSLKSRITITPRTITVTGWESVTEGDDFVYDGMPHSYVAVISGLIDGYDSGITYKNNVATDAGKYVAEVTECTNTNYKLDLINLTYNWEVSPKMLNVSYWQAGSTFDTSDSENYTVVYNGGIQNIYAVASGIVGEDTVNFLYDAQEGYAIGATNAGKYIAHVTGVDNANYTVDANAEESYQNWTIEKRTLYTSFEDTSLVYNGAAQSVYATVSGFVSSDKSYFSSLTFNYSNTGITVGTATVNDTSMAIPFGVTAAGDYTAAVNGIEDSAIALNYSLVSASKDFTVSKKIISISLQSDGVKPYTGGTQDLYLVVNGVETVDLAKFKLEQFTFGEDSTSPSGYVAEGGSFKLAFTCKDAGTYPVKITAFAGDPNYTFDTGYTFDGSVEVARRQITIGKWTVTDKFNSNAITDLPSTGKVTYNYSGYEIGYVLDGVQGGDTVKLDLVDNAGKNAGNYSTTATLDEDTYKNYTFTSETLEWIIEPKGITITWDVSQNADITYDSSVHTATPGYSGQLLGDDTLTLDVSNNSATVVGKYTATINSIGNDNYVIAEGETLKWNIVPRAIIINWLNNTTLTYNGMYQGPHFTVENLVDDSVNVTVSVSRDTFVGINGTVTKTLSVDNSGNTFDFADFQISVDAGKYTLTSIGVSDNSNYVIADSSKSLDFSIGKKTIALTGEWSFTNNGSAYTLPTLTYNKKAFTNVTYIADGEIVDRLGSSTSVTLNYDYTNTATSVGTYTSTVKGLVGTYANNYQLPTEGLTNTWTIVPKVVNIVWDSNSFVYSGNNKTQYATVATGGSSDDDGKAYESISVSDYQNHVKANAGTYSAVALTLDNANYVINQNTATYEWTIAPAPVYIYWNYGTTIYNGNAQAPVASYYNAGLGYYVDITSYDNVNNVTVGNYTVTVTDIADDNYTLVGGSNVSKTYTINPRQIELEWYAQYDGAADTVDISSTLVYNDKSGVIRAAITNLCGNDDVNIVYSGNDTFKTAGSFEVAVANLTGEDVENYTFNNCYCSYTIAKKQLTVTWAWDGGATATNPTFDGKTHTLKPTLSGFAGDDVVTFTHEGDAFGGVKNASEYTVRIVSLSDETNYYISSSDASRSFNILRQPVKITWSGSSTVVYDGNAHKLTATVKGVDDDREVDVAYSYTENEYCTDARDYAYTVAITLNDNNYQIVNNEHYTTLKIDPQPVKITWSSDRTFTYDKTEHGVNATVVGKNNNSAVDFYFSGTNRATNANTYQARVILNNSNYVINESSGVDTVSFTINPKPVTFTWHEADYIYNADYQYCTPTIVGVEDGDTVNLTYSSSKNSTNGSIGSYNNYARECGVYSIRVTNLSNSNYKIADDATTSSQMAINPYHAQVTWNSTKLEYTGSTQTFVPTVLGVNDQNVSVTYPNGNSFKDVGYYTVKVVSNNNNYVITENDSMTCEITPKSVNIVWSTLNSNSFVYYKDVAQGYSVSLDGVVSADRSYVNVTTEGNLTAVNVGNYNVEVTGLSGTRAANYVINGAGVLTQSYSITKQPVTVVWTGSETVDYSGSPNFLTATVYGSQDWAELASTYITGTDAGNYSLTANISSVLLDGAENANYEFTSLAGDLNKTLTVRAINPTVYWTAPDDLTYDGVAHTITARLEGVNGTTVNTFTVTGTDAGAYTLTLTETGNANYTFTDMSDLARSFTIYPATASVEWVGDTGTGSYYDAIVYDAENHTMTATVRGIGGVALKTYTVTEKNAGVYTIVVSETGNSNYTLDGIDSSDLERTMWITPYGAATFDMTNVHFDTATNTNKIQYTGNQITLNVVVLDTKLNDEVKITEFVFAKYDEASGTWITVDASEVKDIGQYRVWMLECDNENYVTYSEGTFATFQIVDSLT